jgi:hypothetical protein
MNRRFIIGAVLLLGTLFAYWNWIRPYELSYAEGARKAADFGERSERVQHELQQLQAARRKANASIEHFRSFDDKSPRQPAIVWIPTHIKSAFARLNMKEPEVRIDSSVSDEELPEYSRTGWDVTIPSQEDECKLTDILLAVAQIERGGAYIKVENLSLDLACNEIGSIGYLKLITYLPR